MLTLRSTACALVMVVCASGCTRGTWPDPPPVDPAKYQQEYDAFQKEQLETEAFALPLVGTWSLDEGDTPFGSDPALPIALPARAAAARAGVFHRKGNDVTVTPAAEGPPFVIGSIHFDVFPVPLAFLIVTSPMKQRLGDLLGGTIVVIGPRAEPDSEDDDES